jgi:hypothetical protein
VAGHGPPPSAAELHAPVEHPELTGHESADAYEEAAEDERVSSSRPPVGWSGDA